MRSLVFFTVAALCCFAAASAFSAGRSSGNLVSNHVPLSACVDKVPVRNDSTPSTNLCPYTLTVSSTMASPGDVIQVLASGFHGARFRGLYMEARVVGGDVDVAVGQFPSQNVELDAVMRIYTRPPGENNAIGCGSRTGKGVRSITVDWKVPEDVLTECYCVYFRAMIFKSYSKFWENVDSPPIAIRVRKVC
ncbi:putative defense protein [Ischnura elegans]|uniref:putative defense protein n=1 Tax=Ischnura elegans TaxID=197161 RepID=UPI001ED88013|nr:putative defense protein [Ischnura elegans]